MRKRNIFVPSVLLALASGTVASGQVRINEVMQSNIDGLFVENEFPDSWIELKNTSEESIDLKGWRIGTKELYESAYIIPQSCIVAPGEYVLIYCDKEGRGLHTDFRVDSGKGMLKLWDSEGRAVETVALSKFPAPDVSCGISSSGKWEYFITPTPGADNVSATSGELLPSPTFEPAGGVYSHPFTLSITSQGKKLPEDALLCVTTDGREPTEADACDELEFSVDIDSSTVVRAKYLSQSRLPQRSVTSSYIFHDNGLRLPIISLTTDSTHLYSATGILYGQRGENPNWEKDWRRPVNVEYFDTDGTCRLNQIGEMRVHGGHTRVNPQKSLAIYAHKRFGVKKFDSSAFWSDKPRVTSVGSFLLRNSGNDYQGAHIIDAFAQRSLGLGMPDVDYQAYRPIVVYINGAYYGLLDLRERSNEDFVEANYDGLDDIDMIENYTDVKKGDKQLRNDVLNVFKNQDTPLEKVAEQVCMPNYSANVSFAVYNCYADWLSNNSVWWRSRVEGSDNRMRILTKDLDHTFGRYGALPSQNPFPYLRMFDSEEDGMLKKIGRLTTYLFDNPDGRRLVASQIAFMAGDFMHPDYALPRFSEMTQEIAHEMYDTYGVNNGPGAQLFNYQNWLDMIDESGRFQTYIKYRPSYIFDIIADEFGLGETYDLEICHEMKGSSFNEMPFTMPEFRTRYFKGEEVRLTPVENLAWIVTESLSHGAERHYEFESGEVRYRAGEDVRKARFFLATPGSVEETTLTERFTLRCEGRMLTAECGEGSMQMLVYDPSGREIASRGVEAGEVSIELPSEGIYIVKMSAEFGSDIRKIAVK